MNRRDLKEKERKNKLSIRTKCFENTQYLNTCKFLWGAFLCKYSILKWIYDCVPVGEILQETCRSVIGEVTRRFHAHDLTLSGSKGIHSCTLTIYALVLWEDPRTLDTSLILPSRCGTQCSVFTNFLKRTSDAR